MIKLSEFHKDKSWAFALCVKSVDQSHSLLHIAFFNYSMWFNINPIVKPKYVSKPHDDEIEQEYGISINKYGAFLYYGIQPGIWINSEPENSDQCLLFTWPKSPWSKIVTRDERLYPNGNVYDAYNYFWRLSFFSNTTDVELLQHSTQSMFNNPRLVEIVKLQQKTPSGKTEIATISLVGEKVYFGRSWLRCFPIFETTKRLVCCSSDVELGKEAGSYKGGLMGWSFEWFPNETLTEGFWRWYKQWDGR